MTFCTNCGQAINEIITIDGKPYGTTCGRAKLGLLDFPSWFKGGDWNKAKSDHDKFLSDQESILTEAKSITAEYWEDFKILANSFYKARVKNNDWMQDFIYSIADQMGITHIEVEGLIEGDFEETYKNWNHKLATFPLMYQRPVKKVSDLSTKQINILNI